MVEGEISRKAFHPTVVPPRARMKKLVDTFREISGNGIIVSEEGETLCAVVSGEFGLPPAGCEAIMKCLQSWQQDSTARIPPPTKSAPRKRSYDQRNYVSGEARIFKNLSRVFYIFSTPLGRSSTLWVGRAGRGEHKAGGTSCSPKILGGREAGERRKKGVVGKVST